MRYSPGPEQIIGPGLIDHPPVQDLKEAIAGHAQIVRAIAEHLEHDEIKREQVAALRSSGPV
jgi:hypothetical protein